MYVTDFITNGQGTGPVAENLTKVRFETGCKRPFFDDQGRRCVILNTGKKFNAEKRIFEPVYEKVEVKDLVGTAFYDEVQNATSLRKDEWIMYDRAVQQVSRENLVAWGDLMSRSQISGFDGMSHTMYEYEKISDDGEAIVDMDGLSEGTSDSNRYILEGIPLPITHSGFSISRRRLAASRNAGMPLNLTGIENCTRRVAEKIEKTVIGTVSGMTYGVSTGYGRTATVYGYTNFPSRVTKTDMVAPTGSNGETILSNWLTLRDLLYDANHKGPYVVYTSTDYTRYLDNLFSTTEPSAGTLREQLMKIDGIEAIKRLDFLTDTFTVLMVSMNSKVVQAINGMDMRVMQWESKGGEQINFKVAAIHVPLLKDDYLGQCGIAHGTTS